METSKSNENIEIQRCYYIICLDIKWLVKRNRRRWDIQLWALVSDLSQKKVQRIDIHGRQFYNRRHTDHGLFLHRSSDKCAHITSLIRSIIHNNSWNSAQCINKLLNIRWRINRYKNFLFESTPSRHRTSQNRNTTVGFKIWPGNFCVPR